MGGEIELSMQQCLCNFCKGEGGYEYHGGCKATKSELSRKGIYYCDHLDQKREDEIEYLKAKREAEAKR